MGSQRVRPTERLNSNSPVLHSRTLLFLCITNSLHLLTPNFQAILPLPTPPWQPWVYSLSLSLLPRQVHLCPVLDSTCKWYQTVFYFFKLRNSWFRVVLVPHLSSLFQSLFHCRLLQDVDYRALCCSAGPCFTILCMLMGVSWSQTPKASPHPHSPLGNRSFTCFVSLFCK